MGQILEAITGMPAGDDNGSPVGYYTGLIAWLEKFLDPYYNK